jgi:hypothetical protein
VGFPQARRALQDAEEECDGPRGIVRPHTDMVSHDPSGRSDDVGTAAGAPS